MKTRIIHADIYTPDIHIGNGVLEVHGGAIQFVGTADEFGSSPEVQVIDARGHKLIPGLIDTHIHGAGGFDISAGGAAGAAEYLASQGITAFLATTHFVMTHSELLQSVAQIAEVIDNPPIGAQILGIHMEGPWIAADRSPFSRADLCYPITREDIALFMQAARGNLRMVTFAPELPGALEVIPWLREQGIIPSAGHTNADYNTCMRAVEQGLNHSTHTYNAMPPLHHRSPGTIGAVMDSAEVTAELIADGFHVLPPMMRLLIKAKGTEHVCLVSDAVPLAGLPAGTHMHWCGLDIGTDGEISILNDGRPAGAYKLLNRSLEVMVKSGTAEFGQALHMASRVPAEMLGLKKGQLAAGFDADLVVMDDDLNPLLTMVAGNIVYVKEGFIDVKRFTNSL
ncbi:N-acetylglucosamine-6-phosphate deacetylase [Pelolinea submarina]|uniref:N-acetylglucosamine 6-phosphate deacetylase n=1 Tax=Pelolinea submarina TaxID=913107 RepID=A0A347ZNU7_9CHLR|nr:N-acetylglucosamine-6-phosphate deacetylase [Pelolinea submarina]REG08581.1 N-acetylglucosamine 6-phosphate deacetylase [Pelolinea submarina]BBB46978.1 N-acetylglucosamine-6-phosphate deacetylase [Pelolinea submarina]